MSSLIRFFFIITIVSLLLPAHSLFAQRLYGVTPNEFTQYMFWLDLDGDQKVVAQEIFDRWNVRFDAEFLPRLWAHSAASPEESPGPIDERVLYENEKEHSEIQAELNAWTEELLGGLKSVLRDDQLPGLQRIRGAQQRRIWRTSRSAALPEGNVDLIQLVDGLVLTPKERAAAEDVIAAFEPLFIAALKKHLLAMKEYAPISRRWERAFQQLGSNWGNLDAPERASLVKESADLWNELGDISRGPRLALLRLNRDGMVRFKNALTETSAHQLRETYLHRSYPTIYPDPASASVLYDLVESFDDLSDEQRTVVALLRNEFEASHRTLSEEMAETDLSRRGGGKKRPDQFESNTSALELLDRRIDLGLDREEVNARQIVRLRSVLTPEQSARLPERNFEDDPPERPWHQRSVRSKRARNGDSR